MQVVELEHSNHLVGLEQVSVSSQVHSSVLRPQRFAAAGLIGLLNTNTIVNVAVYLQRISIDLQFAMFEVAICNFQNCDYE